MVSMNWHGFQVNTTMWNVVPKHKDLAASLWCHPSADRVCHYFVCNNPWWLVLLVVLIYSRYHIMLDGSAATVTVTVVTKQQIFACLLLLKNVHAVMPDIVLVVSCLLNNQQQEQRTRTCPPPSPSSSNKKKTSALASTHRFSGTVNELLFVHLPRWHLSATQTQQKSSHHGAASADGIPSGFWP